MTDEDAFKFLLIKFPDLHQLDMIVELYDSLRFSETLSSQRACVCAEAQGGGGMVHRDGVCEGDQAR